jgi:hypothetical protein
MRVVRDDLILAESNDTIVIEDILEGRAIREHSPKRRSKWESFHGLSWDWLLALSQNF